MKHNIVHIVHIFDCYMCKKCKKTLVVGDFDGDKVQTFYKEECETDEYPTSTQT